MSTLLYFVQALAWGVSYVIALPVPRRYGTFAQLLVSMGLAVFGFFIMFIFKLLPVLGVIGYVMIPFVTPEIAMTEYNMDRTVPINVMWSGAAPFPGILPYDLLSVHVLSSADVRLHLPLVGRRRHQGRRDSAKRKGMTRCAWAVLFILVSFHLLSLTGATPVAVMLLRVFYTVWFSSW